MFFEGVVEYHLI